MAVKRNVVTFGFVSSLNYLVYKPGVLLLYWKSLRRRSFGSLWSAAMIYGYSYADSYRVSPQRFLLPFSFILFLCGCCFLCSAVLASVYGTRTCSWKEGRFTATKKEPGRRDTHKLRIRKPPPPPAAYSVPLRFSSPSLERLFSASHSMPFSSLLLALFNDRHAGPYAGLT